MTSKKAVEEIEAHLESEIDRYEVAAFKSADGGGAAFGGIAFGSKLAGWLEANRERLTAEDAVERVDAREEADIEKIRAMLKKEHDYWLATLKSPASNMTYCEARETQARESIEWFEKNFPQTGLTSEMQTRQSDLDVAIGRLREAVGSDPLWQPKTDADVVHRAVRRIMQLRKDRDSFMDAYENEMESVEKIRSQIKARTPFRYREYMSEDLVEFFVWFHQEFPERKTPCHL